MEGKKKDMNVSQNINVHTNMKLKESLALHCFKCNQCISPLMLLFRAHSGRGARDTTLCDKVCQ